MGKQPPFVSQHPLHVAGEHPVPASLADATHTPPAHVEPVGQIMHPQPPL